MAKRRRSRQRAIGTQPIAFTAPPPRSIPRLIVLLALPTAAVLLTLVVIRTLDLRLGQGSFAYRFSTIYVTRLGRGLPLLALAAGAAGGVWLLARRRKAVGAAVFAIVAIFLAGWAFWAPPASARQHLVDFVSPSHDGAFVIERNNEIPAGASVRVYLQNFDRGLKRTGEEMLGTRVLSNPPGMTILAAWVHAAWPPETDPPGWMERTFGSIEVFQDRPILSEAVRLAIVVHLLWAISLVPAYATARLYLPPAGAAVTALMMWFTPSAVLFTPGKDPAQLLTALTMTWAILASCRSKSAIGGMLLAAIAGSALVVGMTLGLIHFWVALALAAALLWDAATRREPRGVARLMLRQALPALIGAAIFLLFVRATAGWNILATLLAVFGRFQEIQPTLQLNHRLWLLIGLPIFLLFVSPAYFATFALNVRRIKRGAGFGRKLLISTLVTMLATYFVGVPYELPRLWVVFLPLLAVGAAIDLPLFHARRGGYRSAAALAIIAVVHLLFVMIQFSLMDVRESEFRMLTQRLWY